MKQIKIRIPNKNPVQPGPLDPRDHILKYDPETKRWEKVSLKYIKAYFSHGGKEEFCFLFPKGQDALFFLMSTILNLYVANIEYGPWAELAFGDLTIGIETFKAHKALEKRFKKYLGPDTFDTFFKDYWLRIREKRGDYHEKTPPKISTGNGRKNSLYLYGSLANLQEILEDLRDKKRKNSSCREILSCKIWFGNPSELEYRIRLVKSSFERKNQHLWVSFQKSKDGFFVTNIIIEDGIPF